MVFGIDCFAQTGFINASESFLSSSDHRSFTTFTGSGKITAMLVSVVVLALIGIVVQFRINVGRSFHNGKDIILATALEEAELGSGSDNSIVAKTPTCKGPGNPRRLTVGDRLIASGLEPRRTCSPPLKMQRFPSSLLVRFWAGTVWSGAGRGAGGSSCDPMRPVHGHFVHTQVPDGVQRRATDAEFELVIELLEELLLERRAAEKAEAATKATAVDLREGEDEGGCADGAEKEQEDGTAVDSVDGQPTGP
ncbi:hypothetical protein BDK51DRAFT_52089 [Blyttiomyces helicus]|uniref:Uncharacterized protein n=1 Tax=Blyttiomyces helicus TaxID=388810 RepID=A0A4P9VVG8_9FUNG|nr:hypothetical protein BDK51DRAFT_52089 [Blyttiomyces helicus]|eukprot:RKO82815.1 hypothetical protein BDK51DRAFT_52089 [Blyttiomyces helicus]